MRVKVIPVGELMANGYIIADENSGICAVFDPGAEPEKFIDFIEQNNYKPDSIVLTHSHYDHIGGCEEIKNRYNIPIIICEGEEAIISNSTFNLTGMFASGYTLAYDKVLKNNESYKFGDLEFVTLNTPGHTPGCACYLFEREGVMISGDTLFNGSIGRTDFPMGDTGKMIESLKRLTLLDENIIVYPGHGPSTTIGEEKKHNPYMQSVR